MNYEVLDISQKNRAEWLEARRLGVGASEAAAVLGASPWASRLSLWAEKLGTLPADEENEAMYWGRVLEPIVASELARELGKTVRMGGQLIRSKKWPFMQATLDAMVVEDDIPAELKTSCKDFAWANGPPENVWIQNQHQLAVTWKPYLYTAALLGGTGFHFRWSKVERDDEFIHDVLVPEEQAFWESVQNREQPQADGSDSTRDALKALFPKDNGESIALPADVALLDEQRLEADDMLAKFKKQKSEAENRIRQAIGEATEAVLPNGITYTLKANKNGVRSLRRKNGGQ